MEGANTLEGLGWGKAAFFLTSQMAEDQHFRSVFITETSSEELYS